MVSVLNLTAGNVPGPDLPGTWNPRSLATGTTTQQAVLVPDDTVNGTLLLRGDQQQS